MPRAGGRGPQNRQLSGNGRPIRPQSPLLPTAPRILVKIDPIGASVYQHRNSPSNRQPPRKTASLINRRASETVAILRLNIRTNIQLWLAC